MQKHKLSFTTVNLGLVESVTVAEVYLQLGDWAAAKDRVKGDNLLQARICRTAERTFRELRNRLEVM
jgi:hypothetical protein